MMKQKIGWPQGRRQLAWAGTAVGLLALATPAQADTGSATSSAKVLSSIQFAVLLEMDFGTVLANSTGGVVELVPISGTRDCSIGGIVCTGAYANSRLELSGDDATVQVTYDSDFPLTGPGAPMLVQPNFPGGSGALISLTGGTAVVEFGAKLFVNANQAPGTYNGTFSVNVNYQ